MYVVVVVTGVTTTPRIASLMNDPVKHEVKDGLVTVAPSELVVTQLPAP